MRIAYLSASDLPSRAANAVQVMKMCDAFTRNGHSVVLYARRTDRELRRSLHAMYGLDTAFDIVTLRRVPVPGLRGIAYAQGVRRHALERPRADVFYSRQIFALAAVAGMGSPLVFESHLPPPSRVHQFTERWVFRHENFRRLVVISEALKAEYQARFPWLEADRVVVAHDAADPPESTAPHDPVSWPGRPNAFQVGYVGHLYPGKGMEVIHRLGPLLSHMDFHVVGGREEDIQRWKGRNSSRNIHFHGFVAHGDLQSYFSRFDVVLAPYQREVRINTGRADISRWMSPLKIFEYMAAGVPMVCSDLPVLREVLSEKTARLVPPDDLGAWADALRELESSRSYRESLKHNAREAFEAHHTWGGRAHKVLRGI